MPPRILYVMKDLRKVVPPSREILRGIWLSFYYGAKIGVLGANGAGKSSLLRIMAGVDHDFQGRPAVAGDFARDLVVFLLRREDRRPRRERRGQVVAASDHGRRRS